MHAITIPRPETSGGLSPAWFAACLQRERTLTIFALVLWLAMLPTLVALGLDDRTLRGVNVWVKPLKFMASLGLFALSTAWFVGLLPADERRGPAVRAVVRLVVACAGLELVYITVQAMLGEASHYNFIDPLHIALYSAMGVVATVLTATQLLLAWRIARHGRADLPPTWRAAVVLGLVLTFALGAGAGGLLGSMQPPAGAGLPLVGWQLGGGDLRPAHFLGLHAQQLLPLAGLALLRLPPRQGRVALALVALAYAGLWLLALMRGLDGAVSTVPMAG